MTLEELMKIEDNITEIPYSERQLIVIVPDDAKAAEMKALEEVESSSNNDKTKKLWDYATSAITAIAPRIAFYGLCAEVIIGIYNGIKTLRQEEIDVKTVSNSTAKNLIFPPGHPQKKCVYVGNPVESHSYFPLADFHRMMLESKFTEVVNLLMSLGAEEINVERLIGMGSQAALKSDAKALTKDEVGINVNCKNDSEKSCLFGAKLSPKGAPKVPDNLSWFRFEPTWQMISQGRISHGLKNFTLDVNYLENFGIDANLKTSIKGSGLTIGGDYKDYEKTVWKISGQFSESA